MGVFVGPMKDALIVGKTIMEEMGMGAITAGLVAITALPLVY